MDKIAIRNTIGFILLMVVYVLFAVMREGWPGTHLIISPIVIGVFGYHILAGKTFLRGMLLGFIPLAAIVFDPFIAEPKMIIGINLAHGFAIAIFIIPMWEGVLWIVKWSKGLFKNNDQQEDMSKQV